jgi:hypothetical protein
VFEGRTPCGAVAVEFTGFPTQNCEKIKWRLTLERDPRSGRPTTYIYEGTRTRREGTWTIVRGTAIDRDAVVYRLTYEGGAGSVAFLKAGDHLLLLLDRNLRLMVGDASWSYTLSRTDRPGSSFLMRRYLPHITRQLAREVAGRAARASGG